MGRRAALVAAALTVAGSHACDSHHACWNRGQCIDGSCRCDAGFGGPTCRLAVDDFCPSSCSGHGRCSIAGVCECHAPWFGPACDHIRSDADVVCPSSCSGHGRCDMLRGGICVCDFGFDGPDCSHALASACPSACSGHGICQEDGACHCESGYTGAGCDSLVPTCPQACSGHGLCGTGGRCRCKPGYGGAACDILEAVSACPYNCSGHGRCDGNQCTCRPQLQHMFGGNSCDRLVGCPLGSQP